MFSLSGVSHISRILPLQCGSVFMMDGIQQSKWLSNEEPVQVDDATSC